MFIFDDGGRAECGHKGLADDCVVRSIAIVAKLPYKEVYNELFERAKAFSRRRSKVAKMIREKGASPRNGVYKEVYKEYLSELGFKWVPTMKVGAGCTVHLRKEELPGGRLLVFVSRHLTAFVNGVIHDTYDCSRNGTRCVYGYYIKED